MPHVTVGLGRVCAVVGLCLVAVLFLVTHQLGGIEAGLFALAFLAILV